MVKIKKNQEHLVLGDALSAWALKFGTIKDPYVMGLLLALQTRRNLSMWATLSPLEYLPHPHAVSAKSNFLSFITLLRNTLIFAPVALTWAAVGKATEAFGIYVGQNTGAVINFLEFWQDGFGVLSKNWTIGHIATLDFLMILLVIALIIFLHFANNRVRIKRIASEGTIDEERMALGIELYAYLFDKRTTSNVKMNENLASATQDLLHTSSSLAKVVKVVEKSTKETPTNKQIMSSLKDLLKTRKSSRLDLLSE